MSWGVVECFSISSGCLSGAGMSFVCILRTEEAACGMRGLSLNFASIQHFFFFFLLLSLITSSCAGSCLRNTGNFWGFDREDSGKGYNPELGNVYLRKIWLTKFLLSSTLLFYTVINLAIGLAPYFCTRSRARWIVQPQQRATAFASARALPVFMLCGLLVTSQ